MHVKLSAVIFNPQISMKNYFIKFRKNIFQTNNIQSSNTGRRHWLLNLCRVQSIKYFIFISQFFASVFFDSEGMKKKTFIKNSFISLFKKQKKNDEGHRVQM